MPKLDTIKDKLIRHTTWCEYCESDLAITTRINDATALIRSYAEDDAKPLLKAAEYRMRRNHVKSVEGVFFIPLNIEDITDAIIEAELKPVSSY